VCKHTSWWKAPRAVLRQLSMHIAHCVIETRVA